MVADCVGLIKAFFWSGNGTAEAKYAINNCPDKSANGMYALCKTKGAIATIPKTPGLVVWNNGHIGISLDGIWAIEARSFNFGVVKTRIKDRSWTNWGQLPASMLDYVTASAQESDEPKEPIPSNPIACPHQEPTGNLKIRSKGDGVKWVQWMLHACGYNIGKYGIDGDFGSATDSAVRAFQRNRKLVADGIVGVMTRRALLAAVEKR